MYNILEEGETVKNRRSRSGLQSPLLQLDLH